MRFFSNFFAELWKCTLYFLIFSENVNSTIVIPTHYFLVITRCLVSTCNHAADNYDVIAFILPHTQYNLNCLVSKILLQLCIAAFFNWSLDVNTTFLTRLYILIYANK